MTLFESRRTSAYGDDLRWRMVWQKEALKQIGSNVGVDRSTVVRVIELFRTTGKVSKRLSQGKGSKRTYCTRPIVHVESGCTKTWDIPKRSTIVL